MNSRTLIQVIAMREFMTRIRTRVFAITTVLTIVGIGAYILLQAYVFNKSATSLEVGFVGSAQSISAPVRAEAAAAGETINVRPYASLAAGTADLQSGVLDALVSGSGATTTMTVQSTVDGTLETALNDQTRQQVLTEYLTQHDLPPSDVLGQLNFSVNVHELSPVNAARIEQIVIGLGVALTLYVTMVVYGQLVAAGVIEEKSNRIVEILLATVRPWQLMLGKIIGIGLIALLQVVLVAGAALVLASVTKLVSIPTLGVDVVISGVVWFVLGYLMYALLFAAAGSMVSRQEDVSAVALPVILVLVSAWIIALSVAAPDPGSPATAVLSFIPLYSPVGGEVVDKQCSAGQLLTAGATQCFTISDMSSVWILVNVYQKDVAYVHVGDPVTISNETYPAEISGRIQYISPALDPNTRTLQARIEAPNPGERLKKEMYVSADVRAGVIQNAFFVPDASVLRDDQNMPYVYLQTGDSKFARRGVTLGESLGGKTQILTGLQAGDHVVGDGSLFLQFQNSLQR